MKLALINIKHMPSLSEETIAYTADVTVDGVKAFAVSNTGQGGPDSQVPYPPYTWEDIERWNKHVAEHYPPTDMSEFQMDPIPATLEDVCHGMLTKHLARKQLTRLLKSHVLYIVGDEIHQMGFKGVRTLTGEQRTVLRAQVRAEHPNSTILNEQSFDLALAAFMASGK